MGCRGLAICSGKFANKEVELVPVKTARLGTRMKTRPVIQCQSPTQKKMLLLEDSPKKHHSQCTENLLLSSAIPIESFDDNLPEFYNQVDYDLGSSNQSKKRKTGSRAGMGG
jgi:hypothetical protein